MPGVIANETRTGTRRAHAPLRDPVATFAPRATRRLGIRPPTSSRAALIVAARAMDRLGRPRSDIHAFTMPGFATGDTTKSYATRLATELGCTFAELDIKPAAEQMLKDLDHPYGEGEAVFDVTFENVQAGLRTDYLFRLANHRGGIVLGTGDLSELALGWCTYGVGDQMSHYNVNAGVPKTLIQHLIRWVIDSKQLHDGDHDDEADPVDGVLREILEQEITPELIPTVEGVPSQAQSISVARWISFAGAPLRSATSASLSELLLFGAPMTSSRSHWGAIALTAACRLEVA